MQSLTELLQQEQAAIEQFADLLRQEQKALVGADAESLRVLSEHKLRHIETLNAIARQRQAWLTAAGYSADASGAQGWLATQPPSVAAAWQKLMDSARAAQQLNQTNGNLIQTHLQHNRQALSALMSAANLTGTYGADGQPQAGSGASQRSIGKV